MDQLEKTGKELGQISETFCLAKWFQTTLFLQNGYTSSCHHVRAHKISVRAIKKDPSALHNTTSKKIVRSLMKKGVAPKECGYCWRMERLNRTSDRIYKSSEEWAFPFFKKAANSSYSDKIVPTNMEVIFGNLCNFKCSYCNPVSSSLWLKEQKEKRDFNVSINPYKAWKRRLKRNYIFSSKEVNPYLEAFWKWWPELSKSLRTFRISGGEPLLNPNTWAVIDDFIANPKSELVFEINSNMGVPGSTVEKLVSKVNSLEGKVRFFNLYTSIDNTDFRAEYIRSGLNFSKFEENIEIYLSGVRGGVALSFMITMNILCVPNQENLFRKIFEWKKKYPKIQINIDTPYLKSPEYLSIRLLPVEKFFHLERSLKFIESTLTHPQGFSKATYNRLERVLKMVKESPYPHGEQKRYRRDFALFIQDHDQLRGSDFSKTFPELESFRKDCVHLGPHRPLIAFRSWVDKIFQNRIRPLFFVRD